MSSVARAIERDETAGVMKLVVDASTDRILGATILATDGGELVHILSTLMLAKLPYTLLKGAVYIHPTLAEGLFFLMDDVEFDFIDHQLEIRASDGDVRAVRLAPRSVADFYREVMATLRDMALPVSIGPMLCQR